MKCKAIALLVFMMIVPFVVRFRLAAYIAEEALVVVLIVAVGMIVSLFVLVVFALLSEGIRAGFQWLVSEPRRTGRLADRQFVRRNTPRSPSLRDELSNRGVAGSRDSGDYTGLRAGAVLPVHRTGRVVQAIAQRARRE